MKKRASIVIISIVLFSILLANINIGPVNASSFSLLDHLYYIPDERDQHPEGVGTGCGNCWVWAGTGILEIALHVQCGIKDRLSIQYLTSCYTGAVHAPWACCGGSIQNFSDFYSVAGFAIPWSNTNAHWQDGYTAWHEETTVPCGTISTWPRYPITTCAVEKIPTHGVGQEAAINNIKEILHQNRGVQFDFCVPCDPDIWDPEGFCDFWYNQSETDVWDPDWACGNEYYCITGHAVLCVGYNDDDPDNKYWIMLNSWGTSYDDDPGRPNGLFRMNMDMNYDCYLVFGPTQEEEECFDWYTLDVTFDCPLPLITTCNETGQEKDVFDISENVYVFGGNLPSETNLTVYIIPDNMSASPDNAVANNWALTSSSGELPLTLAWESPLTKGDYDIWIDVNQNGTYEETIDVYDDSALDIHAFTAIPEFPSFLTLPLLMIATLLGAIFSKRKRSVPDQANALTR